MPCTLPDRDERRRVEVAVRVEPDHADALAPSPRSAAPRRRSIRPRASDRRRAGAGSGRRADRRCGLVGHAHAHIGDRAEETRAALRSALGVLAKRHRDIPRVLDRVAEPLEPLAQVGVAHRERTHVDAAAARAEIHRHANDPNVRHARGLRAGWKGTVR